MTTLLEKPKLLLVGDSSESAEELLSAASESHEIIAVQNPMRALAMLSRGRFDGVFVTAKYFQEAFEIGKLLQNEQILEGMPDGVVLLECDNTIIWGNSGMRQWSGRDSVAGVNFYAALGSPGNLGPRLLPLPHRLGHRPGDELHASQPGQPLLSGPGRAGPRVGRARRGT